LATGGGSGDGGVSGSGWHVDGAGWPAGSLSLFGHDGRRVTLPTEPVDHAGFHRDLADHLVSGWPLEERTARRTRALVSVLEAARRSAVAGGAQIAPV
jgi:hypothetical protein